MVKDFEAATSDLLTVTTPCQFDTFEKGIYAHLIARPSKRLAKALTVSREVLVLFSNFPDQQPRTVEFAARVGSRHKGRIESKVILIVHGDRHGNEKLTLWGTERGLVVLPLYAEDLPNGQGLERAFAAQLYSHDPFDITGPVSSDNQFYGRRAESLDLARKLQIGQVRSAFGIRKIGKTSVLNRIVGDIRTHFECVCIMLDCSRDDISRLSAEGLLSSIAAAVDRAAVNSDKYGVVEGLSEAPDLAAAAQRLHSSVAACPHPIVVLLDEVDYITPSSPTAAHWKEDFNPFWRNLRSIYQEISRQGGHFSIFIAGVSSRWFSVESVAGVENAALSFVPEEFLSPLAREATIAMLRALGNAAGLKFDPAAADLIASTSCDIPYWSRKACSFIHRRVRVEDRPTQVTRAAAEVELAAFVEEEGAALAQVALTHLFRVYPELEPVVFAIGSGSTIGISPKLRSILQRYGVVARTGSQLSGTMMHAGLELYRETLVAHRARATPPATEPTETSSSHAIATGRPLNEWAEELAVVNRRRNLLEVRLRQVALNFLRYDSLQAGKTDGIRPRVLAALPSQRRPSLEHFTAEALLEKFTWLELIGLVKKEWSLFERLFGDKETLQRNAELVNARYDAHAKDADGADLALYRRSLSFFEDAIARIQ
mgnify:CR=1 FL=1